jgi:hypothetical protein
MNRCVMQGCKQEGTHPMTFVIDGMNRDRTIRFERIESETFVCDGCLDLISRPVGEMSIGYHKSQGGRWVSRVSLVERGEEGSNA